MIAIGGKYFKSVSHYFNQINSIFKTSAESAFVSVVEPIQPVYLGVTVPIQPAYLAVNAPVQPIYSSVGVG